MANGPHKVTFEQGQRKKTGLNETKNVGPARRDNAVPAVLGYYEKEKGPKVQKDDIITFESKIGELKIFIEPGILSGPNGASAETMNGDDLQIIRVHGSSTGHVVLHSPTELGAADGQSVEILYAVYRTEPKGWVTGNSHPRIIIDP